MDPLGAAKDPLDIRNNIVETESIQSWAHVIPPPYNIPDQETEKKSAFPHDDDINNVVALWCGDLTLLNATAIVNSTNEAMSDKSPLSEIVFQKAGPELRNEIKHEVKSCKTGETRLTKGYNLPARYIIHTVGPRYNKYQTAAENALYNCYRNTMQTARENKISIIAIGCIHSQRRHYPVEGGAHIALRTVRRFLEHFQKDFEKVIFTVGDAENTVYTRLMPLYFPRSEEEELYSALHLPENIGNEFGEPIIAGREIRIGHMSLTISNKDIIDEEDPDFDIEECPSLREEFDLSIPVGQHAFAKMEIDHDANRRMKLKGRTNIEAERAFSIRRYSRLLKRAKKEDLTEIASLRCFYQSGYDQMGRPVLIFVAKNFNYDKIDLEKAVLYLLYVMDSVVAQKYIVIYLHTITTKLNQPSIAFLKEIYKIVDERYRDNLHAIYMVHPSVWTRLTTWYFTTFTASHIKDKVMVVPGVEYLFARINPDQLDIPPFVLDYDLKVNGARYYVPGGHLDEL